MLQMGKPRPGQIARVRGFVSWENVLAWPPWQFLKHSYLFISLGEVGPVHFIHSHDYGHHVLPIHYGRRQDVLSLILCEGVHEVTEMLILKEDRDKPEWADEEQRQ